MGIPPRVHRSTSPPGAGRAPPPLQKEHLYKVLVIGDLGVGKTSIIRRYVHQTYSTNYRATIGVDFALKVLNWDSETVRLQLWDIAGQERFGNMTRVYYREAMGAFIVFDVTRPTTFEAVIKWKEDLDSKAMLANGSSIATVLLANKCDQSRDLTSNGTKMDQFCKDHGFVGWFETSAKVNIITASGFHQKFPSKLWAGLLMESKPTPTSHHPFQPQPNNTGATKTAIKM
uniref:Ras-related protein Rab n=1 Tax=Oryzias melastigma TaxID=30732 RepID=A0A3B3C677_ORYME